MVQGVLGERRYSDVVEMMVNSIRTADEQASEQEKTISTWGWSRFGETIPVPPFNY